MDPLVLTGATRSLTVDPPIVLAPMAGITNVPFRTLCRQQLAVGTSVTRSAELPDPVGTAPQEERVGGLFTSEMVGARALVEAGRHGGLSVLARHGEVDEDATAMSSGRLRTVLRAAFGPEEPVRSLQLYATDPAELRDGVGLLVAHDLVDHIDLNFGCPAPKVTRHGGGAALPWRTGLFADLVGAAVEAAGGRPVTVKMRKGIDHDHLTHLEAGRAARDAGAAAVTLHGRTAYDAYAGHADWQAIAALVEAVGDAMPVLGNGDIWQGEDAVRMLTETGCAGVVVGRGCLGRPWLFRDLALAVDGRPVPPPPILGEVCGLLVQHARLLVVHTGEDIGMRELRKHTSWYLQGFEIGRPLRSALRRIERLEQLEELLQTLDPSTPMPESARSMQRGHTHGPKPVRLPDGWLHTRRHARPLAEAAAAVVSGG